MTIAAFLHVVASKEKASWVGGTWQTLTKLKNMYTLGINVDEALTMCLPIQHMFEKEEWPIGGLNKTFASLMPITQFLQTDKGNQPNKKGVLLAACCLLEICFDFGHISCLKQKKNCFDRERAISGAWELPLIWHKKIFFMVDIAWIWMADSSRILSVWKCPWNNFGLREKSGHSKKKKKNQN